MNKSFKLDKLRYSPPFDHSLHFLFCFRHANSKNPIIAIFSRFGLAFFRNMYGLEIPRKCIIGDGFYLGHPYNITINPKAIIGKNCNIHRGVVIGQENRGSRIGAPIIGDNVWIGINSAIVGKITIGNDVLIAPNSYVNCDIPSNSIVYGNPCIIKHREHATEGYINRII